jgi:hypothetical protein
VQLSKYFWAVGSFRGVPSGDAFAKQYKLHYQPKRMEIDRDIVYAQFGCLSFHAKHSNDGGPKLSLAVKNKWSAGSMKVWFYCHVPCHQSSEGGKSMFALCSRKSMLDYEVEPSVDRPNTKVNDAAFICETTMIGGHNTIEVF